MTNPNPEVPTLEEIAEINEVGALFNSFSQQLSNHSIRPIMWFLAGMCAEVLEMAYQGDRDAFATSFMAAIDRHLDLKKNGAPGAPPTFKNGTLIN